MNPRRFLSRLMASGALLLLTGCTTTLLQMKYLGAEFEWKTMGEYSTESGCNRVLMYVDTRSPSYVNGKPYTLVARCVRKETSGPSIHALWITPTALAEQNGVPRSMTEMIGTFKSQAECEAFGAKQNVRGRDGDVIMRIMCLPAGVKP